jgi:DNA-binding transcriptional regulator YiaG
MDTIQVAGSRMEWTPELIKALRKNKKMTQASLAAAIGVTVTTVSRWESEKSHPDNRAAKALAGIASAK